MTIQASTPQFDDKLAQQLQTPFKLRWWMLRRLPMGLLSGMKIESLDRDQCTVVLRDRWWIRNPFGSVFWAVMGMAAEMSTGGMLYAYAAPAKLQFILVRAEARFFKKARGKSYYICSSGRLVSQSIGAMENADEPSIVTLSVQARNTEGEQIAEFLFDWQLRKPKG